MSSSTDLVVTLNAIQKYLYQFGGPILILVGNISCILNLIVFTQKNLRKNPCSVYFIAYNIVNFFFIYSSLLSLTSSIGYNIEVGTYNLIICRLRLYVNVVCNILSAMFLILASIDRILVSSRNACTRQRSTLRLAYTCVIGGAVFWSLFHIHILVLSTVTQIGPNIFLCYFQQGVYLVILSYYALLKELLALSLLIISGLWSVKNIRNSVRRIAGAANASVTGVTVTNTSHSTSRDRQLILMLLMDIIINALFCSMFTIFLLYQQITQYYVKSAERVQVENVVRNLCLFAVGISYCTSCYTNLSVSKTFPLEVKKVLTVNRMICRH